MSSVTYSAKRGVTLPASADFAGLVDNTAGNIGVSVSEKITNGTFDSDASSWTAIGGATILWRSAPSVESIDDPAADGLPAASSDGMVKIVSAGSGSGAYQSITTVAGQHYRVRCYGYSVTGSSNKLWVGTSAGDNSILDIDGAVFNNGGCALNWGNIDTVFEATGTTTYISLIPSQVSSRVAYYDEVYVEETNNQMRNGDYQSGNYHTPGTNWTITNGYAEHTAGSTVPLAQYDMVLDSGEQYSIVYTVSNRTVGTIYPRIYPTDESTSVTGVTVSANQEHVDYLTPTEAMTRLKFIPSSDFDGRIDSVSVYKCLPDDTANNDGLEIHGELTKSAVATGAETVDYSGFTDSNYFEQPYSANIDPGTGDLSVTFWLKTTHDSGANGYVLSWAAASGSPFYLCYVEPGTNKLTFYIKDASTIRQVSTSIDINDGAWRFYVLRYDASAGDVEIWVDGSLNNSVTGTALGTLANTSAFLRIGRYRDDGFSLPNSNVAILTIETDYITDVEIQTLYNTEKHLFKKYSVHRVVDNSYSTDLSLKNNTRSHRIKKKFSDSIDNTRETIVHADAYHWSVSTTALDRTSGLQDVREFVYGVRDGSQFTYDPYGTIASPDESVTCEMIADRFTENFIVVDNYSISMEFREIED